ncbi:hypothetical protein [Enterococcus rotai]|uniref:hypothetical protein n=1 Tax=Enterococcus rotai TaxID=118060 RepID=UPI0032B4B0CB
MSLSINKSITLSAQVKIENKIAIQMTASISDDGNSYTNENTIDQELYLANKAECRKDMAAFREKVYELEDVVKETK